ncbi:winged helix-turn-helix domain-containing protein [Georgenia halophila]|uniref:Winged helix-turn-helix domain-containing protein n=1 Tax=Georgenia halophila TaxID=620889 RepID=A0ABP8KUA8_9MICO
MTTTAISRRTTAAPTGAPTRALTPGQARRVAIAAQGLDRARPAPGSVTMGHLRRLVERIGLLQIDSVNVLARAHLLPVFSRLGPYDVALMDRASGRSPRWIVESWAHVASYVPPRTYRLLWWRRAAYRKKEDHYQERYPGLLEAVRDLVAEHGPVTAGELHTVLGHERGAKEHWGWNWTPAKHALEHLWDVGEVAVARRTSQFERAYDVTERVLPPAALAEPAPAKADAIRELVRIAARAHGIGTVRCLADYFRTRTDDTTRAVLELVEEGALEPVHVPGWGRPAYLDTGARVPRRTGARALLAPFDPLVFERDRLLALWGMHYRIGIYTPPARRTHGYYVLPFLLGEHLVARVDLKADRQAMLLRVRSAFAETPDHVPGLARAGSGAWPARDAVVAELVAELGEMATWLGMDGVAVDLDAGGDLAADVARAVARR